MGTENKNNFELPRWARLGEFILGFILLNTSPELTKIIGTAFIIDSLIYSPGATAALNWLVLKDSNSQPRE